MDGKRETEKDRRDIRREGIDGGREGNWKRLTGGDTGGDERKRDRRRGGREEIMIDAILDGKR